MTQLFGREILLNIAGVAIKTKSNDGNKFAPILRVGFKVTKSLKKEPNTAEITIYNLKEENRIKFQEKESDAILEVGYTDNTSQIFSGQLSFASNKLVGQDWVTTMQAGDGSKQFRQARINTSLKGPIKIGEVLKTAADSMGLNLGNIKEKIAKGSIRETLTEFVNGITLSGKSEQQLDKVIKSMGYSWSIQDGAIELLEPTETIPGDAVLLTPGTGMIGNPEAGEKGIIKVKTLIQPNLLPGRKIKIESKNKSTDGFFRIEKAVFSGDTWGNNWDVDIEAKPL